MGCLVKWFTSVLSGCQFDDLGSLLPRLFMFIYIYTCLYKRTLLNAHAHVCLCVNNIYVFIWLHRYVDKMYKLYIYMCVRACVWRKKVKREGYV